jgi:hypothetical protein
MVTLLLLLITTSCHHAYSYYFTNYWQNWKVWNRKIMAIQPSICKLLHKMSLKTYMCSIDLEVEKNIYILCSLIVVTYKVLPALQFFTVCLQTSWYTPHSCGSFGYYFWHCNDLETLLYLKQSRVPQLWDSPQNKIQMNPKLNVWNWDRNVGSRGSRYQCNKSSIEQTHNHDIQIHKIFVQGTYRMLFNMKCLNKEIWRPVSPYSSQNGIRLTCVFLKGVYNIHWRPKNEQIYPPCMSQTLLLSHNTCQRS